MARTLGLELRRFWMHVIVALCTITCILLLSLLPSSAAQVHPLPPTLAQWNDASGDYFDQVQKTSPEYLIWSKFPVKVYLQPAGSKHRDHVWVKAVDQAIQEWSVYLPLQKVDRAEDAEIVVDRSSIPIRFPIRDRVRFAETRFDLYKKDGILLHRMSIRIRPSQPDLALLAAARHELGHALGIWGHSPIETDALFFSQVRTPPPISPRDVNTLRRVYEQPTRLGWRAENR